MCLILYTHVFKLYKTHARHMLMLRQVREATVFTRTNVQMPIMSRICAANTMIPILSVVWTPKKVSLFLNDEK